MDNKPIYSPVKGWYYQRFMNGRFMVSQGFQSPVAASEALRHNRLYWHLYK